MRRALTLLEVLIVLFIIAGLLALLTPALMRSRESARRANCESNLRQLSMAMRMYMDAYRRVPDRPPGGQPGGWSVALLQFLEQKETAAGIMAGSPFANELPAILRCPSVVREAESGIPIAHYALATNSSRDSWEIGDAPQEFHEDWLSGPEVHFDDWRAKPGPHSGGSLVTSTDSSVDFISP